jgi:hypothetical protein
MVALASFDRASNRVALLIGPLGPANLKVRA